MHGRHSFGEIPYGDVCFLSLVWVAATPTGRKLSSRTERESAERESEIALLQFGR